MSWPTNNTLIDDPARQKRRYTGAAPGGADYFDRVKRYNTNLYAPTDTKPQTPTMPTIAPPRINPANSGWQTGDPMAIAARYGTPGAMAMMNTERSRLPSPVTGAAGDTGDLGDEGSYGPPSNPSIIDTAPRATMPDAQPKPSGPPAWFQQAQGNASQRWREMGSNPANNGPQGRMAGSGDGGSAPSTDRFYQRKQARDMQLSTHNPAARDRYRRQRNTGYEPYD